MPLLINTAFITLLATPIATTLSRNSAFVVLVSAVLLLAVHVASQEGGLKLLRSISERLRPQANSNLTYIVPTASILFASASLLWSPLVERGLGALAQTTSATLAALFGCLMISQRSIVPPWLTTALILSLALGSAVVAVELLLESPIRGAFGASIEAYRLNRAALCLALMVPLLFIPRARGVTPILHGLVVVSVGIAVFLSESESAKLALLVVFGTLVSTHLVSTRVAIVFLGGVIMSSHVFAPLIALFLNFVLPRELGETVSLQLFGDPYYFVRIEIWWAHAQQILSAPIVGHGLQASLAAQDIYTGSDPAVIRGLSYGHPHSLSMQVWYELGLVGTLLSGALIWLFLRSLASLQDRELKVAMAITAGVWGVAYVGHGAWQHWWWALVGILALLFVIQKNNDQARA